MEELKDIIKEIQGYKTSLGLKNLSDDMILDCSTRIFNSNNIENNYIKKALPNSAFPKYPYKNRGSEYTPKPNATTTSEKFPKIREPNSPATDNQKRKLFVLGIKYPKDITKFEAYKLISEKENGK